MNLYFWFFVLYAVLITPVGAQVHVRIDHGVHYRIRLRAAGLPVLRKKEKAKEEPQVQLKSSNVLKGMKDWDYALFVSLLRQGHLQRLLRLFEWHDVQIDARISFEDAAFTAMTYALIRICLQTVARCRPLPVQGRVEMDFRGEGTMISFRCIADARLGSLSAAALRLWLAAVISRAKRLVAEEEKYAASH